MHHVRKVIAHHEKVLWHQRLHWIYLLEGLCWLVGLSVFGVLADIYFWTIFDPPEFIILGSTIYLYANLGILTVIPIITAGVGIIVLARRWMTFFFSEVVLTDRRLIHKEGMLMVDINEFELEDIRAEHIHQTLFSWLFGYGMVRFDFRYIKDQSLPAIANPYRFMQKLLGARMALQERSDKPHKPHKPEKHDEGPLDDDDEDCLENGISTVDDDDDDK